MTDVSKQDYALFRHYQRAALAQAARRTESRVKDDHNWYSTGDWNTRFGVLGPAWSMFTPLEYGEPRTLPRIQSRSKTSQGHRMKNSKSQEYLYPNQRKMAYSRSTGNLGYPQGGSVHGEYISELQDQAMANDPEQKVVAMRRRLARIEQKREQREKAWLGDAQAIMHIMPPLEGSKRILQSAKLMPVEYKNKNMKKRKVRKKRRMKQAPPQAQAQGEEKAGERTPPKKSPGRRVMVSPPTLSQAGVLNNKAEIWKAFAPRYMSSLGGNLPSDWEDGQHGEEPDADEFEGDICPATCGGTHVLEDSVCTQCGYRPKQLPWGGPEDPWCPATLGAPHDLDSSGVCTHCNLVPGQEANSNNSNNSNNSDGSNNSNHSDSMGVEQ